MTRLRSAVLKLQSIVDVVGCWSNDWRFVTHLANRTDPAYSDIFEAFVGQVTTIVADKKTTTVDLKLYPASYLAQALETSFERIRMYFFSFFYVAFQVICQRHRFPLVQS